ncbi:MAG: STAS domain-containing protein [Lachnospiraceae bacterium]|nr:STAS domain-containing protein [Lachnospiraceae bacterium]
MSETIYKTEKRIDIKTAPKLEAELKAFAEAGNYDLVIDMEETTYISSVGLRALLSMQKEVNKHSGTMLIRNVSEAVRDVFDVTGFSGLLTIEE